MTNRNLKFVEDDIAFMRAMAQEGRDAPLLSGPIMIAAALIFGVASVCQWAIMSGAVDVTPWAMVWVWVASGVLFIAALAALSRRIRSKPGQGSVGNRAVGAAWSAVGFGIFAAWVAFMAQGLINGDWTLMRAMPILVFTAYGSAWMVAGAMSGRSWMKGTGVAAYAGAAVLGLFSNQPVGFLVFAALLVLVALIPGLVLARQEPAEVI